MLLKVPTVAGALIPLLAGISASSTDLFTSAAQEELANRMSGDRDFLCNTSGGKTHDMAVVDCTAS